MIESVKVKPFFAFAGTPYQAILLSFLVIDFSRRSKSPGAFFSQKWIIEWYFWSAFIVFEHSGLTLSDQLVKGKVYKV